MMLELSFVGAEYRYDTPTRCRFPRSSTNFAILTSGASRNFLRLHAFPLEIGSQQSDHEPFRWTRAHLIDDL